MSEKRICRCEERDDRLSRRQFARSSDFRREAIRLKEPLPPTGLSEATVVDGKSVQFASTRLQDQFLFSHFPDNPILIDLVRVKFSTGGWTDVFGARTRRTAILLSRVNDPIIGMERIAHRLCPFRRSLLTTTFGLSTLPILHLKSLVIQIRTPIFT